MNDSEPRGCRALVAGSLLASSVWLSLGRLQDYQNADSIVPVLVSLQKWTPLYWGADRYGMLVPLLALPFHHPLVNLVIQTVLNVLAGLAASVLVARYVMGPAPVWLAAGLLPNVWLLLLTPPLIQFYWLWVVAMYGISLSLAMLSLLTHRRWLAVILMGLAHWVNVATFLVVMPLVVARALVNRDRVQLVHSAILSILGATVGLLPMFLSTTPEASRGIDPLSLWPAAWWQQASQARHIIFPNPWVLLWIFLPWGAALVFVGGRHWWPAAVVLLVPAVVNWLVTGTLAWVRINHYRPSYLVPSLILVGVTVAAVSLAPLERHGRALTVAMALLLLGSAAYTSGWPSPSVVRNALDRHGAFTSEILASEAEVVVGHDYWTLWPAVFHATLVSYERGLDRPIYGDGYRGQVTRPLWPEPHRTFTIP